MYAPRKIVCLETYWSDHKGRVFQNTSVRPFLEALGSHFDPPIRIAHRFVDTFAHLSHYVARPDGLFWRDAEVFDAPVFYLSFHGSPGTLLSALENVGAETLCKAFEQWGASYENLVYFGACRVFEDAAGEAFARAFLASSRCRAIIGYTASIDWLDSMMADLLFLKRFFSSEAPWENLRAIHNSVVSDFAPARALGYTLRTQA